MLERRQDGVRDEEDDSMQGFNWFFETLFNLFHLIPMVDILVELTLC